MAVQVMTRLEGGTSVRCGVLARVALAVAVTEAARCNQPVLEQDPCAGGMRWRFHIIDVDQSKRE